MFVALTIDTEHPDRPHCPPGALSETLGVIEKHRVDATFFLLGRWASAYPAQAKAVAEAGHLIGNHSHFHIPMKMLDDKAIRSDIESAEESIIEATGVSPKPWFRLPFLNGADEPRVLSSIETAGYRHIGVHAAGGDWIGDRTAEDLAGRIVHQLGETGGIVLLHSWPAQVPACLDLIITQLRALGAEFIRIDSPSAEPLIRTAKPSLA